MKQEEEIKKNENEKDRKAASKANIKKNTGTNVKSKVKAIEQKNINV